MTAGHDFLRELASDPRRRSFGPVDTQSLHTALPPRLQPPSNRPLVDPEVQGDLGVGSSAMHHQDRMSPIAKASILRGLEDVFELLDLPIAEIQVRHRGRTWSRSGQRHVPPERGAFGATM